MITEIEIPSTAEQENAVYNYLLEHVFINTFIAFDEFHITRLAAVIWNLKNKRKIPISSVMVHSVGDDGSRKQWKNYWIEK